MSDSSASASSNRSTLPDSSARRTRPAVSWPLSRRWRISGRISSSAETAASVTVAFSQASLATRWARSSSSHARAVTKSASVSRQLGDQRLPRRRRQIVARQHGFADGGEMAVALDDAVERERRDLGLRVLDQHQAGLGRPDLGDGGGDRARQPGAAGDRGLRRRAAGRHRIDQVGIDQERRMLEHQLATSGWSAASARITGGGEFR